MTIKQQGGIFGRNPTFNDVEVEGTLTVNGEPISDFGTMAQQDADSVNIDGGNIDGTIIGASSTAALSATTGTFGGDVSIDVGAGNPKMLVKTAGAGNNPYVQLQASTNVFDMMGVFSASPDYWRVGFGTGGAASTEILKVFSGGDVEVENGNLVIGTSGQGIDFSATSGTGTSELFDDYEEGTWTPVDAGGNVTYSSNAGSYTKVGNLVTAFATLLVPTNSDANALVIGGLPFAVSTSGLEGQVIRYGGATAFTNSNVNTTVSVKTDETILLYLQDGTQVVNSQFSNKSLKLFVVYQAA